MKNRWSFILFVLFSLSFLLSEESFAARIYANKVISNRDSLFDIHKRIRDKCLRPSFSELVCLETPPNQVLSEFNATLNGAAGEILTFQIIGGTLTFLEDGLSIALQTGGELLGIETPHIDREELSWKLYQDLRTKLQLKADRENLTECQRVALAQCPIMEIIQADPYSESLGFLITRRPKRSAVKNGFGACGETTRVSVDLIQTLGVKAKVQNGYIKEPSETAVNEATWKDALVGSGNGHTWVEVQIGGSRFYLDGGQPFTQIQYRSRSNPDEISNNKLMYYTFTPIQIMSNDKIDHKLYNEIFNSLPNRARIRELAWGIYINETRTRPSPLSSSESILSAVEKLNQ